MMVFQEEHRPEQEANVERHGGEETLVVARHGFGSGHAKGFDFHDARPFWQRRRNWRSAGVLTGSGMLGILYSLTSKLYIK